MPGRRPGKQGSHRLSGQAKFCLVRTSTDQASLERPYTSFRLGFSYVTAAPNFQE